MPKRVGIGKSCTYYFDLKLFQQSLASAQPGHVRLVKQDAMNGSSDGISALLRQNARFLRGHAATFHSNGWSDLDRAASRSPVINATIVCIFRSREPSAKFVARAATNGMKG